MLNSNKGHAYSRTRTLTFAVLLSFAGLGHVSAQTHSPQAGRFEQVFGNRGRVDPTFIRPEVISGLPSLPISPDESAPEQVTTASTNPPEAPETRGQPGRASPSFTRPEGMKRLSSALEKLVISPAEAESSLAPPPRDVPQQSGPRETTAKEPPNQPTVTWRLPVARLITNSHLNRAAHKTLPPGTWVRVVNKKNNRSMIVRINDRTPAKAKGVVDLSHGSARALGITGGGPVALQKAQ